MAAQLDQLLTKCEQAITRAKSGQTSKEQFKTWLLKLQTYLEPRALAVREVCADPEWVKENPKGSDSAMEGLELFEEGFEECHLFLESGSVDHLERALEMMRRGNQLVNESYDDILDNAETLTISGLI